MTLGCFIEAIKKMGYKTTCKNCKKKIRKFCRLHNIAKNSVCCELAQDGKFAEAKDKMF